MSHGSYQWWQQGVIYQIYPRSFQDSDADGIGDLAGIDQRLDYLQWLGVDAIWLSPIYPSPMADFGYDVADYTGVDPMFGTLEDLDRLVQACHGRGLKLLLDFVPNHSSDQHPWFIDSRSGRHSAKRDWYLWADPGANRGPPNNWLSAFGRASAQQPTQSRLSAGRQSLPSPAAQLFHRPAGGPRGRSGHARRRRQLPRAGSDRRDLPADRAAGELLRRERQRRPPAVQFPTADVALERATDRPRHQRLRGRVAPGRLAQLGARQP